MKTELIDSLNRFSNIMCVFGLKKSIRPALVTLVFAIALPCLHAAPLWATDHSGPITINTTWYAADNPHVIVSGVTVQAGVTLTLEDGVEVRFNSGQWISVYGTLTAMGTPGTGILFTRSGATNGSGLYFYTNGSGRFEYCTIEHVTYGIHAASTDTISLSHSTLQNNSYGVYATGGTVQMSSTTLTNNSSYGFYGSGVAPVLLDGNNLFENNSTGIYLWNIPGLSLTTATTIRQNTVAGLHLNNCTGHPTLDNLTLQGNSGSYGAIYMQDTGEFTIADGNTIGGSGQENRWPLTMNMTSYPSAASSGHIPSSGNTNNGIQVYGGSTVASVVWRDVGIDYIVTGNTTISAGRTLDIEDGVSVKFDHGQGIDVYGTLNAAGSAGIQFTRYEPSDEWGGLRFLTGSSGTLQHCAIGYATYGMGYGIYANGALPTIEHCTIGNNDYGIYVENAPSPSLSAANTIQDNGIAGIYFYNCTAPLVSNQTVTGHLTSYGAICMDNTGEFTIGGGNTIGGSGGENSWPLSMNMGAYPSAASSGHIPSSGNINNDIQVYGGSTTDSVIWRDVGLDYIATSSPTISAGGMLEITDDVVVKFEHGHGIGVNGTLNARGTGSILFTRRELDDQWAGLQFLSGSSGTLQHCTIEYATYSAGYGIYASSGTDTISLSDCTIQNNRYGVRASGGALSFRNNQIIDNADYGIHLSGAVSPSFGSNLSQWNDIYNNGNGNDGRNLRNGTWDTYAPYVYWGTIIGPEIETKIWDKEDDLALGVVHYTPWSNAAHDQALSVELAAFTATGGDGEVTLNWETGSEHNNQGFEIYRRVGGEEFVRVNVELIPGAGNSAAVHAYTYVDRDLINGVTYHYKLADVDFDGNVRMHDVVVSAMPTSTLPKTFALMQNYPNPFNPATHIRYELAEDVPVKLSVYNVRGRQVITLVNAEQEAGYYEVDWMGVDQHGGDLASGVYFYRLDAGERVFTRKMVLLK